VIAEIWCDGAAEKKSKATTGKKNLVRGPAGAGYVVELGGGTREIRSEPLGNKTRTRSSPIKMCVLQMSAGTRGPMLRLES
jgi:hypothetical protein